MFDRFTAPGGHTLIGLYHAYGRKPFLEHFAAMKADGASEEALLDRYRQLHPSYTNETHLRSWFRDQVLHPHETQHTLAELLPVMAKCGMTLEATSINRFGPIDSIDAVVAQEKSYEGIAEERLREGKYFPGFFVVLARKTQASETLIRDVLADWPGAGRKRTSVDTRSARPIIRPFMRAFRSLRVESPKGSLGGRSILGASIYSHA